MIFIECKRHIDFYPLVREKHFLVDWELVRGGLLILLCFSLGERIAVLRKVLIQVKDVLIALLHRLAIWVRITHGALFVMALFYLEVLGDDLKRKRKKKINFAFFFLLLRGNFLSLSLSLPLILSNLICKFYSLPACRVLFYKYFEIGPRILIFRMKRRILIARLF